MYMYTIYLHIREATYENTLHVYVCVQAPFEPDDVYVPTILIYVAAVFYVQHTTDEWIGDYTNHLLIETTFVCSRIFTQSRAICY